jgi:hypothetical protein
MNSTITFSHAMRKLFGASNVFTECLSYLGNILTNRIFAFVSFQFALVFFVSPVLGQNCTDLFLLNSYDGKVYSISALDGSKTLVTTMTTGKSNLAVGLMLQALALRCLFLLKQRLVRRSSRTTLVQA